jgi:hypothetical protein
VLRGDPELIEGNREWEGNRLDCSYQAAALKVEPVKIQLPRVVETCFWSTRLGREWVGKDEWGVRDECHDTIREPEPPLR